MKGILVDSNVILDVFEDDPEWSDWSEAQLEHFRNSNFVYINSIIYTEVSIAFKKIEELEKAITGCGFRILHIPKEGLFLAVKVSGFFLYFIEYFYDRFTGRVL